MLGLAQNMVSAVGSAVNGVAHVAVAPVEAVLDIFTHSDKKIMDLVYATHVHKLDDEFDEDSMFVIVESIIKRSHHIVSNVLQGTNTHAEIVLEDKQPKVGFVSPMCTLKSICSELSCKPAGDEYVHSSTMEILKKLSEFSWDSKAVLALAAFCLDYGDFWLLAQTLKQPDQLTKSLAILRRVTVLLNPVDLRKRQKAMLELNALVMATFEAVEVIFALDRLSSYDPKDVPALTEVFHHLPVDVYWIISSIVACTAKLSILTSDVDKPYNLAPYAQKVQYILNKLNTQLILCTKQVEEVELYRKLRKLFRTPTEITEILKVLVFPKLTTYPIFDGFTRKTVSIEVLRKKNVFLFFSSLDITDEDINILRPVYEETKKKKQYNILWIPIVDVWTEALKVKFNTLSSKMPWLVVQAFTPILGLKFVVDEWNYKGKPIVVHLNPQGKVELPNVIHHLKVWGIRAFPFTKAIEEVITREMNWVDNIIRDIDAVIPTWIKEDKFIFFYGGKDKDWIQSFESRVASLTNDPVIKEAKISFELFHVGKPVKGKPADTIVSKFWGGIESVFLTKVHSEADIKRGLGEIQKLLGYKNEIGWVLLTKGSTVIFASHGVAAIKVVEEVDTWKVSIKDDGFEVSIKDSLNKVTKAVHHCSRLEIPNAIGKLPNILGCPECPRVMETFITYKCCHVDNHH